MCAKLSIHGCMNVAARFLESQDKEFHWADVTFTDDDGKSVEITVFFEDRYQAIAFANGCNLAKRDRCSQEEREFDAAKAGA